MITSSFALKYSSRLRFLILSQVRQDQVFSAFSRLYARGLPRNETFFKVQFQDSKYDRAYSVLSHWSTSVCVSTLALQTSCRHLRQPGVSYLHQALQRHSLLTAEQLAFSPFPCQ